MLPGPDHRQQIIGVTAHIIGLPAGNQEIFERRETDTAIELFAIKGLAQRPAGIDPAHRGQSTHRRFDKMAVAPAGVQPSVHI